MARFTLVAHWDWVLANFRIRLAVRIRDLGHEVHVVCPHGEHLKPLVEAGFEPIHWEVERRGMQPFVEGRSLQHLSNVLRELEPDVIQAFTIKPNIYAPLAAPDGVPVLGLFSGLGWAFGPDLRAVATRRALRPVARRAFQGRTDVHLATQNPEDRDLLVEHGWARPEQLRVLPNGVDVRRFARADDEPIGTSGDLRIVTACRLLRDKGVGELVAAVRQLRRAGRNVHLDVAGDVDPGNPGSMTPQEVGELAATDGVTFHGMLGADEVVSLLHSADVAVLASAYNEGTPRFLLEAAAAGLALVGSDIPGVRRVIIDRTTGLLVPARDVEALASALGRLDEDRATVQRLGAAAHARAVRVHDEERVIDAWFDWYRQVGALPSRTGAA